MKQLASWIRTHQLAAFFILTFVMSWGIWFAPGAVLQQGNILLTPLIFVYACSPALAGIIISAVSSTEARQGSRLSFWVAFLFAWIALLLVEMGHAALFSKDPLSPVIIGFYAVGALLVAFVISSTYSRIAGVRSYLSSLIRLRRVWGWAILAMIFIPALILLSVPLSNLMTGRPLADYPFPELSLSLLGLVAVKFIYQLFFFNSTGEEVGWRGFALPRLQARTSPLVAALIIALFWAPWHFFFWQAEGKPVLALQFWADMFLGHILFSIFIVWICNRAKGNILVAGIAHAATNTTFAFVGLQTSLPWVITAMMLILVDRMWKKLPHDHPVVYSSTELPLKEQAPMDMDHAVVIVA